MTQPLASIHPQAKIGNDVIIDPFVTIKENVEIGEGTWIGSAATIMSGSRIGKNCRIFPGAVIGAIPQDLKFEGEETLAIIGDNTTIREYVTVNRGTKASGKTIVGNNCLLMAYVHIAHDCILGNNCILSNSIGLAGHVQIKDWAIIGAHSGIHQFVRIGEHVMLGAGALVGKDVPPYVMTGRDPIAFFAGINTIGLRRRNFSADEIRHIQDIYKIIYAPELNTSQAVKKVEETIPQSIHRDLILNFIKSSERGIINPPEK